MKKTKINLTQTDDATVWAKEFMEETKGKKVDYDLMHAWFSSAIVSAQDVVKYKNEAKNDISKNS